MTFIRKHSGDREKPIVCAYTCPRCGEFDAEVKRDENGEAPDVIECGNLIESVEHDDGNHTIAVCLGVAAWTPSPTVGCRVRRIEVVKGKWEKPERKTYLDTRELGEGMDIDEFRAKRAAIWEEKRQQDVMAVKKGFE